MANDKLDNLVKIGQLKPEQATAEEIAGLTRSGLARLADARNKELSKDSRFDLAYSAAHALALAALRAAGYRSANRYLVFQCTQYTLDLPAEQWRILDAAHRRRNLAEYEGEIDIEDQLLDALIGVADVMSEKLHD